MEKIKVKPEGREGIYLVEKDEIINWIKKNIKGKIHNFIMNGGICLGADWDRKSVYETIQNADRIGILTPKSGSANMRHHLSVIKATRHDVFDIGEITEDNLLVL